MKRLLMTILLMLMTGVAHAQSTRINLDFPALADKASETVDVTLDGSMLRLAAKFLSGTEADERAARGIVERLEGIYVRSYTFDEPNAYDASVLGRIRSQLGPSWKRIVTVRSKKDENTEIYVDGRGDAIVGLVIINSEPKELTLVNLVGPIDIDKLTSLRGQFGIPRDLTVDGKEKRP